MSKSKKKTDIRWLLLTLALLAVIVAIVMGVLTNWYTDWNKFCLFGHDYGETDICNRCGKDKPNELPVSGKLLQRLSCNNYLLEI